MSEHLPRHRIEQLVAEDPRVAIPPALRVHLAACDECSVKKRALETARARFLAAHPAPDFAQSLLAHEAELAAAATARAAPRRRFSWPWARE